MENIKADKQTRGGNSQWFLEVLYRYKKSKELGIDPNNIFFAKPEELPF